MASIRRRDLALGAIAGLISGLAVLLARTQSAIESTGLLDVDSGADPLIHIVIAAALGASIGVIAGEHGRNRRSPCPR